jgi:hypothetical protein
VQSVEIVEIVVTMVIMVALVIMVTVVIMGWATMATTMGGIVIGVITTTMAVTTLTVTGCGTLILTSMYGPVNQ